MLAQRAVLGERIFVEINRKILQIKAGGKLVVSPGHDDWGPVYDSASGRAGTRALFGLPGMLLILLCERRSVASKLAHGEA